MLNRPDRPNHFRVYQIRSNLVLLPDASQDGSPNLIIGTAVAGASGRMGGWTRQPIVVSSIFRIIFRFFRCSPAEVPESEYHTP